MKNKAKKNNSFQFLLIVLTGLLIIFLIVVYFNNSYNQSQITNNSSATKTYESENLKFGIKVPRSFSVKSSNTGVDLVRLEGSIEIVRNGTNFDNLSDYISTFDARRNIVASEVKKISIDGRDVISRIVDLPEENIKKRSYYIYVDYSVYILSTSSSALFGELDKIAQSFKYTP